MTSVAIEMGKVRESVGESIYDVSERRAFESEYIVLYFAVDTHMRRVIHQALREDTA